MLIKQMRDLSKSTACIGCTHYESIPFTNDWECSLKQTPYNNNKELGCVKYKRFSGYDNTVWAAKYPVKASGHNFIVDMKE